jgi:MFS family permease
LLRQRIVSASPALKFVLTVGVMSFFADFTYAGSRSIVGPYLGTLGAGALAISVISGLGEFLGYGLRLLSGRGADRTGRYWPITIGGYTVQMAAVPLLALAGSWQVAALLIIAERVGKATRNPPRDAMLSHAARDMGYGWGFGVHEALDQFGAMFGPLLVALILSVSRHDYRLAFAALAVPAVITLSLVLAARRLFPRPQDLAAGPAEVSAAALPRVFWLYLAGAALAAAGFADFPLIAFHFQRAATVQALRGPASGAPASSTNATRSGSTCRPVSSRTSRRAHAAMLSPGRGVPPGSTQSPAPPPTTVRHGTHALRQPARRPAAMVATVTGKAAKRGSASALSTRAAVTAPGRRSFWIIPITARWTPPRPRLASPRTPRRVVPVGGLCLLRAGAGAARRGDAPARPLATPQDGDGITARLP